MPEQTIQSLLGPEPKPENQTVQGLLGPEPSALETTKNFVAEDARHFFLEGLVPDFLGHGEVPGTVARDQFFHGTAVGRVLDAFGQGAKDNWGAEPLGLSDETQKWLSNVGILSKKGQDYTDIWRAPLKAFNDAIIKPGAMLFDAATRGMMSGAGAVAGAAGQTVKEITGNETAGEQITQDVNLLPLALGDVGLQMPKFEKEAVHPLTQDASDLGIIGNSEEAPAVKASEVQKQEAPAEQPEIDAAKAEAAQSEKTASETTPAPEPKPVTVEDIAREKNPALANQWQSLVTRRDTYRQWLADLSAARASAAASRSPFLPQIKETTSQIGALETKMADTTPRLAKKYQARIADLKTQLDEVQRQHDAFIAEQTAHDTPDMARVRTALMQNDYRMRDLAPDISSLYREAAQNLPETPQEAAPAEPAAQQPQPETAAPAAPQAAEQPIENATKPAEPEQIPLIPEAIAPTGGAPNVVGEEKTGAAPEKQITTPEHVAAIERDVEAQLVRQGRPEEEARAAAQITASHYETRANRFEGQKGNAYELYRAEGPVAKSGRSTTRNGTINTRSVPPVIRMMASAHAGTFMHESGHAWLEELMRDATDERAPDQLKADAQTVRDWLGTKEGEALPRKAHEKFARGFEQYLYTGRAPSAKLARVFAQFRQWLTNIYQNVRRLGAPISDDIRDVFDRLIVENPERQPLLSNEPVAKILADLHEADAEAPGEVAAALRDNVHEEMARTGQENPPLNEDVGNGPESETGRGAGNPEETGGARPENAGRSGAGGAAAPETVGGGAGEAQPEGAGARAGAAAAEGERGETALVNRPGPKEVPLTPHTEFGPQEKPEQFFDKAGNIRLDNLNRPEDIKSVLRMVADDNNGFIEARGGVKSLVDQQQTADALGLTPETFTANRPEGVSESTWLRAVRDLTLRSATDVHEAMVAAKNSGSDMDAAVFAKALARHRMIQEEFSRAKAESGRALAANRWDDAKAKVEGVGRMAEEATGMTLDQLKEMARDGSAMETPAQVSKFIEDASKPTMRDKVQYVALNGLISGPVTHMTYEIASMMTALEESLLERPVAAAYGSARDLVKGEPTPGRVYWGEVGASLTGIYRGSRDGVRAALDAWRNNLTSPLPGEEDAPLFEGHGLIARQPPIGGAIGTALGVPGRMINALHSFNRNVYYAMSIETQAVRAASDLGLSGDALAHKTADLVRSPTPEMMDAAVKYANDLAYMKKPEFGSFMYHIERAANRNLATKLILPFTRVASNIIDRAYVERTPIGLLKGKIRDDLLGKNGAASADLARARMTAGALIGGALVGLAIEGRATGAGPTNPSERALWLVDHQPYSVRIGDTWIAYKRLGHIGMLMGLGANLAETAHVLSDKGLEEGAVSLIHGIASNVVDESWMAGLSNFLKLLEDPKRAKHYIYSFGSEMIPFSALMRQTANAIDPYMRQENGIGEQFQNMVPIWREQLPPARDVWGNKIPSRESAPYALMAAPFQHQIEDDPTSRELLRVGVYPSRAPKKISQVPLTDKQWNDYARVSGRLMKARLDELVRSPGWSAMPDGIKLKVAHSVIDGSRAAARGAILMQYPDIIQKAVAAKMQALQ